LESLLYTNLLTKCEGTLPGSVRTILNAEINTRIANVHVDDIRMIAGVVSF